MFEGFDREKIRDMDLVVIKIFDGLKDQFKSTIDMALEAGNANGWYTDDVFIILMASLMKFTTQMALNLHTIPHFGVANMPEEEYRKNVVSHFIKAMKWDDKGVYH